MNKRKPNSAEADYGVKNDAIGSLMNVLKLGYGLIVIIVICVLAYVVLETETSILKDDVEYNGDPSDYSYARNAPQDLGDLTAIISGEKIDDVNIDLKDIDTVLPKSVVEEINISKREVGTANARIAAKSASIVKAIVPKTWRKNEKLWAAFDAKKPSLVIVIDDMGIVERASEVIADIKGPFTLAYLPYANHLERQVEAVSNAGHELIVHMPMEPKDKAADPGDNALLANLSSEEFSRRLDWNMKRFKGYVGINNHMGSLLTERAGDMVHIMAKLKANDLLFLDSVTSPKTTAASAAKAVGVPYASRDIFLDNNKNKEAIITQLSKAEAIAKRRGYAIAIGHPYNETLEVLREWRATLDQRGFQLVPLSQIIFQRSEKAKLLTSKR